jgi:hypothetical protein
MVYKVSVKDVNRISADVRFIPAAIVARPWDFDEPSSAVTAPEPIGKGGNRVNGTGSSVNVLDPLCGPQQELQVTCLSGSTAVLG